VRYAFTASPHLQQAISRAKLAACLLVAIISISGCISPREVVRTPLPEALKVSESIQSVSIALLPVASVLGELPEGSETLLVSLPDEVMIKRGETWFIRPSPIVVPITDVLMLGLRYTGLSVESHQNLRDAKRDGARVGILAVLTKAEVNFAKRSFFEPDFKEAEAVAELSVVLVDLDIPRVLWAGSLRAVVRHDSIKGPITPRVAFIAEGLAGSFKSEFSVHPLRTLLAQSYFHLSQDLAIRIQEILVARKQ
jgi:hypothetical protein